MIELENLEINESTLEVSQRLNDFSQHTSSHKFDNVFLCSKFYANQSFTDIVWSYWAEIHKYEA